MLTTKQRIKIYEEFGVPSWAQNPKPKKINPETMPDSQKGNPFPVKRMEITRDNNKDKQGASLNNFIDSRR
ncbi:hypothetical protein HMPREF1705_03891 [Acetomicrobium hydrogeniformans ATCC BAA-1850]|jgi:hypothetical protein|uniref:Uncharacterized protein n=1 Tax=Acetomicrobium hydrogeniformans ATCC BAA-1850 TaxID=592015 RepID=A0A0T5X858_9BACT|nr:hypothetical protein HMPREF1705_03891 [Acetomicrobium hydrogeniformans ATCC BAA-1850]